MQLFYASIGGGITGIETLILLIDKINNNLRNNKNFKKNKIVLAIIDRDPSNIPGGVAYGFKKSLFGYFNNPLRLSPKKFNNWVLKNNNKLKLINYLKIYGGHTGKEWIKKNRKILLSAKSKKLKELYVPRVMMNYWMQEKLISKLKSISNEYRLYKKNLHIKFFKGDVTDIIKDKNLGYQIIFKNNKYDELDYKILNSEFEHIIFKKKVTIKDKIISKNLSIGLGLPPPKQIATIKAQKNNNYIWDFYVKGSTAHLIEKILLIAEIKKKILIYFVGYKAGLLEALPELSKIITKMNLKVKIICSSRELQSIQKAELSLNKNIYKPKIFTKNYLSEINTAKKLYYSIFKEFQLSINSGHNKYDAWTYILKKNIIYKVINKFNYSQKKSYDDFFHGKIRNITRFAYPTTIIAREFMFKKKILEAKKEIVKNIDLIKGNLIVTTTNDKNTIKKYKCDIVVNVSGPLNAEKIKNEMPLINKLKKRGAKIISGNIVVNNSFEIVGLKNVFVPGILARGFNPERKTIINAILKNSNLVANSIGSGFVKK